MAITGIGSRTGALAGGHGRAAEAKQPLKGKSAGLLHLLKEAWPFLRPQRALFLFGLALMAINRLAGLVLPASTKFLVDNVIGKRQIRLLAPLALAIIAATAIQGVTSFTLTQLLSKAAQRMIAQLRKRVQAHIGRLSITFHDVNKTGSLVSRIMTDVEGLRNLMGTGLVELAGSLMTASFALVILLRISAFMTAVAAGVLLAFGFALNKAIGTIRPIFRARSKINAEVTGRLTESLGGVRVVKGYHAEEREERVFSGGVQRLLENVLKTLTATSLMSLSASVLMGLVSAMVFLLGGRQVISGGMTPGTFVSYTIFLGLLVAPVVQIVAYGTQVTEALAGLERTREILNERPEDETPDRDMAMERIQGRVVFEHVDFAYEPGQP